MSSPLIPADVAAARARAAIAFAAISHADLAERSGLSVAMIGRITSRTQPRDATIERLWSIADACDVPRSFMERGFGTGERERGLEERMAALERIVTGLEDRFPPGPSS